MKIKTPTRTNVKETEDQLTQSLRNMDAKPLIVCIEELGVARSMKLLKPIADEGGGIYFLAAMDVLSYRRAKATAVVVGLDLLPEDMRATLPWLAPAIRIDRQLDLFEEFLEEYPEAAKSWSAVVGGHADGWLSGDSLKFIVKSGGGIAKETWELMLQTVNMAVFEEQVRALMEVEVLDLKKPWFGSDFMEHIYQILAVMDTAPITRIRFLKLLVELGASSEALLGGKFSNKLTAGERRVL